MSESVDDVAAFEQDLARRGKRRLLLVGVALAVVALGVVLLLMLGKKGADAGKLASVRSAMARIDPGSRPIFAAAALAETGAGRIPEPLRKVLEQLQSVPPDLRPALAARSLVDPAVTPILVGACPGGPRALAGAVALPRGEQTASFCGTCSALCARVGRAEREPVALTAFAAVVAEALARSGGVDPTEQRLLGWLLGTD